MTETNQRETNKGVVDLMGGVCKYRDKKISESKRLKSLIFRTVVVFVFCFRVTCMYATEYLDYNLEKKKKNLFPFVVFLLDPLWDIFLASNAVTLFTSSCILTFSCNSVFLFLLICRLASTLIGTRPSTDVRKIIRKLYFTCEKK